MLSLDKKNHHSYLKKRSYTHKTVTIYNTKQGRRTRYGRYGLHRLQVKKSLAVNKKLSVNLW